MRKIIGSAVALGTLAASFLAIGTAASARPAHASCAAHAYTDWNRHNGYVYGNGNMSCDFPLRGYDVYASLYGGPNILSKGFNYCAYTTVCYVSTGSVRDRWSGRQEWCTRVVGYAGGYGKADWDCILH